MKVVLHGTLAERYGAEHVIQTDVVADAIEGLSRQLPDWPRELVLDVVGYPTEHLLFSRTDDEEIHILPRMYGGGGKWGSILIGAAMIGLAFATGGGSLGFAGLALSKSALVLAGAGMIVSGVAQMFMKAPTIDKSADPPASKYLGLNRNTTEIGTSVLLGWGRMKISGHWLSLQNDADNLVTTSFPASTA